MPEPWESTEEELRADAERFESLRKLADREASPLLCRQLAEDSKQECVRLRFLLTEATFEEFKSNEAWVDRHASSCPACATFIDASEDEVQEARQILLGRIKRQRPIDHN